jgi:uncharacterized protein (DUF1684 family)
MLMQKRLKELLHYDPKTGVFMWLRPHQAVRIGAAAGTLDAQGYIRIKVDGVKYRAHRLAWLYVTGDWPTLLDHRDMDKAHNAFANLRLATDMQSQGNRRLQRNNTSGFRGVSWFKPTQRWRVILARKFLGYFDTKEAATAAYVQAARAYFGEFARAG